LPDKDAVARVAADTLKRFGRIDVLVNSAGLNARNRNWHNVTLEDWDRVIRVDLDGAFYCAKAVLPAMVEQRDGLIINISSWAGKYTGILTGPAYGAAKHAMNSMTESLNMEAGIHGIRACAVCPGEVATPILDSRPIPVTAADKARMLQARTVAKSSCSSRACRTRLCQRTDVSPTWNRSFVARRALRWRRPVPRLDVEALFIAAMRGNTCSINARAASHVSAPMRWDGARIYTPACLN
jgi:NAD(P)-dependent dehydrogenase (short-subunit alcohol dehydrogenase family)